MVTDPAHGGEVSNVVRNWATLGHFTGIDIALPFETVTATQPLNFSNSRVAPQGSLEGRRRQVYLDGSLSIGSVHRLRAVDSPHRPAEHLYFDIVVFVIRSVSVAVTS